jgi:hypothetical protein
MPDKLVTVEVNKKQFQVQVPKGSSSDLVTKAAQEHYNQKYAGSDNSPQLPTVNPPTLPGMEHPPEPGDSATIGALNAPGDKIQQDGFLSSLGDSIKGMGNAIIHPIDTFNRMAQYKPNSPEMQQIQNNPHLSQDVKDQFAYSHLMEDPIIPFSTASKVGQGNIGGAIGDVLPYLVAGKVASKIGDMSSIDVNNLGSRIKGGAQGAMKGLKSTGNWKGFHAPAPIVAGVGGEILGRGVGGLFGSPDIGAGVGAVSGMLSPIVKGIYDGVKNAPYRVETTVPKIPQIGQPGPVFKPSPEGPPIPAEETPSGRAPGSETHGDTVEQRELAKKNLKNRQTGPKLPQLDVKPKEGSPDVQPINAGNKTPSGRMSRDWPVNPPNEAPLTEQPPNVANPVVAPRSANNAPFKVHPPSELKMPGVTYEQSSTTPKPKIETQQVPAATKTVNEVLPSSNSLDLTDPPVKSPKDASKPSETKETKENTEEKKTYITRENLYKIAKEIGVTPSALAKHMLTEEKNFDVEPSKFNGGSWTEEKATKNPLSEQAKLNKSTQRNTDSKLIKLALPEIAKSHPEYF